MCPFVVASWLKICKWRDCFLGRAIRTTKHIDKLRDESSLEIQDIVTAVNYVLHYLENGNENKC